MFLGPICHFIAVSTIRAAVRVHLTHARARVRELYQYVGYTVGPSHPILPVVGWGLPSPTPGAHAFATHVGLAAATAISQIARTSHPAAPGKGSGDLQPGSPALRANAIDVSTAIFGRPLQADDFVVSIAVLALDTCDNPAAQPHFREWRVLVQQHGVSSQAAPWLPHALPMAKNTYPPASCNTFR